MSSLTENFNYLQPTSFKLVIDRKNFPNLEFFCQQVTHPGLLIPSAEVPVRRMQSIPLPGESLTINELSAEILLDENMESYTEMYSWILRNQHTNLDTHTAMQRKEKPPTYADITLSILSSHNNTTVQVRYVDAPADKKVPDGMYYNKYYSGNLIGMPQPLYADGVEYADGTKATPDQMAKDVTAFLAWASEPELEKRKSLGVTVMLFLLLLTILSYLAMKQIWAPIKKQ